MAAVVMRAARRMQSATAMQAEGDEMSGQGMSLLRESAQEINRLEEKSQSRQAHYSLGVADPAGALR